MRRFGSHGARSRCARAGRRRDGRRAATMAAKSVSQEHTFDVDTADWEVLEQTLLALSRGRRRPAARDRTCGASTVAVKIRDTDFATITRQRTLRRADRPDRCHLADRGRPDHARRCEGMRVRLLGVAASGLTERAQLPLFDAEDEATGAAGDRGRPMRCASKFGSQVDPAGAPARRGRRAAVRARSAQAPGDPRPIARSDTLAVTRRVDGCLARTARIDNRTSVRYG